MRNLLLSTILLVFSVGTMSAQTLIAHWPLDGNTVEVINSLNATAVGGVSWVNDAERGDCALLDGVDGVISLPSVIWESETDTNATISCWFNWAGGDPWQRIYSLGRTDPSWQCMYYCISDNNGYHHVTFKTVEPVDQWYDIIGDAFSDYATIETDTWYFSTVVMEENQVKIYINGQMIIDTTIVVTPQRIQPDSSINVIGQSHWPDPTFNGMIDDFRIYGEALTDQQIQELYAGPDGLQKITARFAPDFYGLDGKISYTPFDESRISHVSVYNLSGSLLFSSDRISDLKDHQFEPGLYLVSVISGTERITRKVTLVR